MKYLLSLILIVRVTIPMGHKQVYEAEDQFEAFGGYYKLTLTNGHRLWVPIEWTVLETK